MSESNQQEPVNLTVTSESQVTTKEKKHVLPFSNWWPPIIGALVGIILRLGFMAPPGSLFSPMNWQFILLTPIAVGAVTVYFAEVKARRSWNYYLGAAALANVFFVLGTMLILIEGLICAIIIVPLFAVVGAIAGLVMGAICRSTNWPKQAVYSFAILPLLLAIIPPNDSINRPFAVSERAIIIDATPEKIWHQLHNVNNITADEVGQAWMYRIGVPLPLAGVTQVTPEGLVRKITMGKSVHFDQISNDWQQNRYVKWRYRFYSDSFPPNALDDHVKIGGHYFDIVDTEYILNPINQTSTELKIRMHYRVSTQFDWYASPVGKFLIGNFEEVILNFYRHRSMS